MMVPPALPSCPLPLPAPPPLSSSSVVPSSNKDKYLDSALGLRFDIFTAWNQRALSTTSTSPSIPTTCDHAIACLERGERPAMLSHTSVEGLLELKRRSAVARREAARRLSISISMAMPDLSSSASSISSSSLDLVLQPLPQPPKRQKRPVWTLLDPAQIPVAWYAAQAELARQQQQHPCARATSTAACMPDALLAIDAHGPRTPRALRVALSQISSTTSVCGCRTSSPRLPLISALVLPTETKAASPHLLPPGQITAAGLPALKLLQRLRTLALANGNGNSNGNSNGNADARPASSLRPLYTATIVQQTHWVAFVIHEWDPRTGATTSALVTAYLVRTQALLCACALQFLEAWLVERLTDAFASVDDEAKRQLDSGCQRDVATGRQ
ncbi:hypothetical protein OC842_006252 [Tilletia horrida]|uniref:Uncharacterized protein n=1 Tax=Tilletia horrida TaxID=155126 RepID=A0AAN6G6A5_9BASI|nr:hypothetical protein OC842_006252 [Tilletia horrida]